MKLYVLALVVLFCGAAHACGAHGGGSSGCQWSGRHMDMFSSYGHRGGSGYNSQQSGFYERLRRRYGSNMWENSRMAGTHGDMRPGMFRGHHGRNMGGYRSQRHMSRTDMFESSGGNQPQQPSFQLLQPSYQPQQPSYQPQQPIYQPQQPSYTDYRPSMRRGHQQSSYSNYRSSMSSGHQRSSLLSGLTGGRQWGSDRHTHGGMTGGHQDAHHGMFQSQYEDTMSQRQSLCTMPCTMEYTPICGSNGVTYANQCEMTAAACRLRMDLRMMRSGMC